jgi:hypothetical protein
MSDPLFEILREPARAIDETDDEPFDRVAFARRALHLVRPRAAIVAICEGASRMRVESGRLWGRGDERWAMVAVPPRASRRAIALAVTELASLPGAYVLDLLMDEATRPPPA